MPKRKSLLIFALKFIFSFSIIAYLLIKIAPIKEIVNVVRGADLSWLILSFSLHAFGYLFSSLRWQILIKAQGDFFLLAFLSDPTLWPPSSTIFFPRASGEISSVSGMALAILDPF